MDESAKVKIPRTPKGPIPQYFQDPATDKLLSMTLELIQELSVTYDRLDTIEQLLIDHAVLKPGEVDDFLPNDAIAGSRASRRSDFLTRVMRPLHEELRNLSDIDRQFAEEQLL